MAVLAMTAAFIACGSKNVLFSRSRAVGSPELPLPSPNLALYPLGL